MPDPIHPIRVGSLEAGGYFARDEEADVFIEKILQEPSTLQLVNIRPLEAGKWEFPTVTGRPKAFPVSEGGLIKIQGARFARVTVYTRKFGTIVLLTREAIEDFITDPESLVEDNLIGPAFASAYEVPLIGHDEGVPITSNHYWQGDPSMVLGLASTPQEVTLDFTKEDWARRAGSKALAKIRRWGHNPDAVSCSISFEEHVRDARRSSDETDLVYQALGDLFWGRRVVTSSNWPLIPAQDDLEEDDKVIVGLMGDFSQAPGGINREMEFEALRESTLIDEDDDDKLYPLAQADMRALKWTSRLGFHARDVNKAFVRFVVTPESYTGVEE